MTCSNSRWMKPAQVFAQFTNGNEKGEGHSSPSKERSSTEHGHASREIQITETGEVCLAPDKARVSIFCTMTKVGMTKQTFFLIWVCQTLVITVFQRQSF